MNAKWSKGTPKHIDEDCGKNNRYLCFVTGIAEPIILNYTFSRDLDQICWFDACSCFGDFKYDDEDVIAWHPLRDFVLGEILNELSVFERRKKQ